MVVLDNDRPGSIVLESFWISHKHAQLGMAAMESQPTGPVTTGPSQTGLGLVELLGFVGLLGGCSGIAANGWPKRPGLPSMPAILAPLGIIHLGQVLLASILDLLVVIWAKLVLEHLLAIPLGLEGQTKSGAQMAGPNLVAIEPLEFEPFLDLVKHTHEWLVPSRCTGILDLAQPSSGALAASTLG